MFELLPTTLCLCKKSHQVPAHSQLVDVGFSQNTELFGWKQSWKYENSTKNY